MIVEQHAIIGLRLLWHCKCHIRYGFYQPPNTGTDVTATWLSFLWHTLPFRRTMAHTGGLMLTSWFF